MVGVTVRGPNVKYTDECIEANYRYDTVSVEEDPATGALTATPVSNSYEFLTKRKVPRTGLLLVGLGGNNGTTVVAGIIANRKKLQWQTKDGPQNSNWYGSITMCSTLKLGLDHAQRDVHIPIRDVVPMSTPCDWVVGGWDINSCNLGDAMRRARVLDYDLQKQIYDEMKVMTPMPGIFDSDFVAANQAERADNIVCGTKDEQVERIRENIRDFKSKNKLDKVIVLWTANTERYADIRTGFNDTEANLMASINQNADEISPSTLYCVASILEGCSFINGSPQNTFVPGLLEFATREGIFLAGDDFKSGQTKIKSVLMDFLVTAGLKPTSIVSYNHLGNNDGYNLSSPSQFRSKELSKSNVVDDMVASNTLLYPKGDHPDHCVVIKYVPSVGDSKRAMDEYTSEIFMGGRNTIAMHNTCEDSLLAAPLIIDLVVLTELFERVSIRVGGPKNNYEKFHSVLSVLSYLCKAPVVPPGTPVKNALFGQRECLLNILRALVSLPPENYMSLEHKTQAAGEYFLKNGLPNNYVRCDSNATTTDLTPCGTEATPKDAATLVSQ